MPIVVPRVKLLCMYKLMLDYNVLPISLCLKFGFDNDLHVPNTIVHMYCSGREWIEFARKVFNEMCKRDSVS